MPFMKRYLGQVSLLCYCCRSDYWGFCCSLLSILCHVSCVWEFVCWRKRVSC